jgi:hypothetical protein
VCSSTALKGKFVPVGVDEAAAVAARAIDAAAGGAAAADQGKIDEIINTSTALDSENDKRFDRISRVKKLAGRERGKVGPRPKNKFDSVTDRDDERVTAGATLGNGVAKR